MVAETPTDGRCNAHVVDKIGLEVSLSISDRSVTDRDFDVIRLESEDGVVVQAEACYEHCRKFLWDDYEVTLIGVETDADDDEDPVGRLQDTIGDTESVTVLAEGDVSAPDTKAGDPPTEDIVWVDISSIIENITNRDKDFQGYCERYAMKEKNHCYVHQGGGAVEGNTNPMTHGLYAQRTNFYNALDDDDKEFIEAMVDSWIDQAPFDRDNAGMVNTLYRCAIDQLKAWFAIDEYVDDNGSIEGVTKEQTIFVDGEVKELEDEHPINMPYSRLTNDVRTELKDLGIYESPEKQNAEATESLARKLSGLGSE